MLRDRYAAVDLFALVPALELRFEPELDELDRLLDDHQLFQQVWADLSRRRPQTTATGRPSTPVEAILRLLVIQHVYGWSYAETEHFVGDAWCYASSAGWAWNPCRTAPRCCAGPTCCSPRRCIGCWIG